MVTLAELDVVWLSRVQFSLTIMFHYLFPPLTIGMGVVLVFLEFMYLRTREAIYETATKFWTKVFALNFALGVATGIVMEFQFGTNWAAYSRFVGDVFGAALAAEGIFAFFLESGFLAVLVFGWDRVGPGMHFFSTLMVAIGGIFSSIWIVIANSWQQTPAGHQVVQMMRDGEPWFIDGQPVMRAEVLDFGAMLMNPSTTHRLVHVWLGAFILGAFFIMSIAAWYVLKNRHVEFARRSFTGALLLATTSSIAILFSGHLQAKNVYEHQPAKLAAFEGHFKSGPADLSIFGIPDAEAGVVRYNLAIPGGLSFLLFEDFDAWVMGLDRIAPEHRPPVVVPFMSYHLMVALGFFFIGSTVLACLFWWRGRLFEQRWLMWVFVLAVPLPFVANEVGWVAAEVGRQPWSVYPESPRGPDGAWQHDARGYLAYDASTGLLTRNGVSESVTGEAVLGSIIMFSLIYAVLFVIWIYVLNHKIQQGPEPVEPAQQTEAEGLIDAAAARVVHRDSMTEAKEPES